MLYRINGNDGDVGGIKVMVDKAKGSASTAKNAADVGTIKKSGRKGNSGSFKTGKAPGPGRPKGVPNKVTQELGEAARA